MPAPGLTPSSMLRGIGVWARGVTRALRAMDARRWLVLLAAAGLLASLFAPWSAPTVTARGLSGPRRITETLSGWQGLSLAAVVCAAVGVLVAVWVVVRSAAVVEGLGARGRRAARARIDGGLLVAAGTACTAVLIAALAEHPGPAVSGAAVSSTSSVGWGVGLALGLAVALLALGLAVVRAAAAAAAAHGDRRAEPVGAAASVATPAFASDQQMPDFDFAISSRATPPAARPIQRRARPGSPFGRKSGRDRGVFSRTSR